MKNNRNIGNINELLAVKYLELNGYKILERNYFIKNIGEIDIIANDSQYLVFIEVKYRSSLINGFPREAVNLKKQQKISKTASYYIFKHQIYENTPIRFDVVEIYKDNINLIKNAFNYVEIS